MTLSDSLATRVIIISSDRARIDIERHVRQMKGSWTDTRAVSGTALTLLIVLLTGTFKQVFLTGSQWEAVFFFAFFLAVVRLVLVIRDALVSPSKEQLVAGILADLTRDSVNPADDSTTSSATGNEPRM